MAAFNRMNNPLRRGACLLAAAILAMAITSATLLAPGASAAPAAAAAVDVSKLPAPAARDVDYDKDVKPIFARACYRCHGPDKQKSSYRLDRKAVALGGGSIGGAIKPGNSAASKLIHYVAGLDEDVRMPPKGKGLSAEQIAILRAWIDQGAKWPDTGEPADPRDTLWSLQPLTIPKAPSLSGVAGVPGVPGAPGSELRDWVRTPIDAFILAALAEKHLSPSPQADRRTLIRRVTFDLIGLPPTPAQIDAFIADDAPGAYERVVDRLLASPRYGERWARHWMDVAHFAETHGHDEDAPRDHAWPYRDYLVDAFNTDKRYARFVREQLAGDVLYPADPAGVVATGFIAAGPWDESSQMGIQDGTTDKQVARYIDRDDMLTTAMSTFVSLTVQCARCHDHKFDPISQDDYYSLQAVFAGVDRVDRPYDADPKVHAARRALTQRKVALEHDEVPQAELLAADAQAQVAQWEKTLTDAARSWIVLDATSVTSAGGATATKQPDGSVLFSGAKPQKDTYTITATSGAKRVTAVMLEVLTDDSLAHKGPGRQDNGNLHLSEFKVKYGPAPDSAAASGAAPKNALPKDALPKNALPKDALPKDAPPKHATLKDAPLTNPTADFNQDGWGIERAIDGNPATAWGIFPQVGQRHFAVFQLAQPIVCQPDTQLTFILEQLHGGCHLIGRPRLSVTAAPAPVATAAAAAPPPPELAAMLSTPPGQRTSEQKAKLARHVLLRRVEEQLAALPAPSLVYAVATDFARLGNFVPAHGPRPVEVLRRGDVHSPIRPAQPGALTCLSALQPRFNLADPSDEGARRAALADWIADPGNVLTWRSIVNRIWHYHFGRGIVATPNDFGHMGDRPTNRQLLDWLAVTFRDGGGSLKALHRLIVTSAVYRQSSQDRADADAIDPDNRLLWRMTRSRLDAECVRDAVLQISGKIDLTMGGPSARQFIATKGVHVTPNVDYEGFDPDNPANFRRSVYRFVFRTLPDPLMEALDCPDASQLTARRDSSVTVLQALAMLNNRFMVRQTQHLAARLQAMHTDRPAQIAALYALALGRPPTDDQAAAVAAYADKHGLANACRVILNSNAFMFVD